MVQQDFRFGAHETTDKVNKHGAGTSARGGGGGVTIGAASEERSKVVNSILTGPFS